MLHFIGVCTVCQSTCLGISSIQRANALQGTKIFQYCTCPAGQVTYNFHLSCKHMHLSFKSVFNKEHNGVICNMTSSSNSSQSTRPVFGKNYSSFLDFTRNYERTSGIFVPSIGKQLRLRQACSFAQSHLSLSYLHTQSNRVDEDLGQNVCI